MSTETQTKGTTTWQIDPAHTQVDFSVKHMMFAKVRGSFEAVEGALRFDPDNVDESSVRVEIDAGSINTGQEDRDAHLRSADFLDVEEYPTITFESRNVVGLGGDRYDVTGDLSIHGVTREVTLEATLGGVGTDPWGNERCAFSASTKIDRRDYGLTWNQALETGGILVGEHVNISIDVQATQASD